MLQFNSINLRRGTKVLLDQASLNIHPKQKVGLIGANGTGKSSLFGLIRGEYETDAGDVKLPDDWVIAHVKQETPNAHVSALDYALQGDTAYAELAEQLKNAEQAEDGAQLAALHAQLEAIDGYSAPARAAQLLSGLGFAQEQHANPVTSFSGGWRMRLNLAQALMCRSDLLLLDEPTNHLDLDTVFWLQTWLERYPGTLLLISHDRDFLDAVVGRIAHFEHQDLHDYKGNYSAFELQRAARLEQQQAAFVQQQQTIAHLESFITRFKAQATKAKQAQSRVKMLERMTQILPAHTDNPFKFSFETPDKAPTSLLSMDKCTLGYDQTPILSEVGLSVLPGDRIGLLGPNGAGKSTLIKFIAGELQAIKGDVSRSKDLKIGYFAQHQLDQLHQDQSPFQHLNLQGLRWTEQKIYNHLGGFGFSFERCDEPIHHFSGGEKARLVLALLVAERPNLLLLDEPTNHLDLDMRQALSMALQSFTGALVVVSHDRFLLSSVCDNFLLVSHGCVTPYEGDLHDYRQWLEQHNKGRNHDSEEAGDNPNNKKALRQQKADVRQRVKPLQNKAQKCARTYEQVSERLAAIEAELAQSELYEPEQKARLTQVLKQQQQLKSNADDAENDWMMAEEALETAMALKN